MTLLLPASLKTTRMSTLYHTLFTYGLEQGRYSSRSMKKRIVLNSPFETSIGRALLSSPFYLENIQLRTPIRRDNKAPLPIVEIELGSGESRQLEIPLRELPANAYYSPEYLPEMIANALHMPEQTTNDPIHRQDQIPTSDIETAISDFKNTSVNHASFWESSAKQLEALGCRSPEQVTYIPFVQIKAHGLTSDFSPFTQPEFELIVLNLDGYEELYYKSSLPQLTTGNRIVPFTNIHAPFANLQLISLDSQKTVLNLLRDDSGMVTPEFNFDTSNIDTKATTYSPERFATALSLSQKLRESESFSYSEIYHQALVPLTTETGIFDRALNRRLTLSKWVFELKENNLISPDTARRIVTDIDESIILIQEAITIHTQLKEEYLSWFAAIDDKLQTKSHTTLPHHMDRDIKIASELSTILEQLDQDLAVQSSIIQSLAWNRFYLQDMQRRFTFTKTSNK